MRSISYDQILNKLAQTKPDIKNIMDDIYNVDIDTLNYPKYIKVSLKEYQEKKLYERRMQTISTNIDAYVTESISGTDIFGDIRCWIADATFVEINSGHIEILPNKLIWIPTTGGYWYETIFVKKVSSEIYNNTVYVDNGHKLKYHQLYREQINCKINDAHNTIIDLTGNTKGNDTLTGINIPGVSIGK